MLPSQKYSTRQQIGRQVGIVGIMVNASLFAAKCTVGLLGNSTSILADAFNSLTDCVSSLTTFIGFKLCGKQADEKHPNGYGRMEYICGFIVSFLIMAAALSFGKTAVLKILNPQTPAMPRSMLWIPLAAVVIKLLFACYTDIANRKIESAALKTICKDSLFDAVLTGLTVIPFLFTSLTDLPLDGIIGLLISGGILWSGFSSFIEHLDLLLGTGDDVQQKEAIKTTILRRKDIFRDVLSINTFDFGPEKQIAYIQVLLNISICPKAIQMEIDRTIQELKETLHIDATIYWDSTNDISCLCTTGSLLNPPPVP